MDQYAANTLKAVTYRIASVPAKQLPALVPHVTATLPVCKSVLSSPQSASGKDTSETAVLVHKFRTQISTLLQDRSVEGRWSAVILAKSAIELGGWEMLQKCGPWVRGLLGILTKPDPPATKVLTIVTLTRIFMLTRDYQTLVREITTPSLTPFITSCMSILSRAKSADQGTQQLVETVLESFARLLPRHPTTFRPHLSKINQFLSTVVAQPWSGEHVYLSADGLAAARSLYAQMPNSAAKGASKDEWEKTLKNVITAAHQAADKVFRAVIEDWESVTGVQPPSTTNRTLEQVVQQLEPDQCGFPGWTGIYAGSGRLIGLLELLSELTASSTAPTGYVSFRIAHVMDLLTRVLSVTSPAAQKKKSQESGISFNDQVGKEERNDLFTVLPQVHVAALALFEVLVERFGSSLSPVMEFFLERLTFVFQEGQSLANVRAASYSALSKVLPVIGSTLPTAQVKSLNPIMHACCEDLLPRKNDAAPSSTPATANANKNQLQTSMNADTFLVNTKNKPPQQTIPEGLVECAHDLLPLFLLHLPAQAMDNSIRARIDSTAVLVQHEHALLASILSFDPRGNPSLLPLLARLYPGSPEVESLLRPRVPAIRATANNSPNDDVEEDDDEEEDDEEAEPTETADQKPTANDDNDKMQVDDDDNGEQPVAVRTRSADAEAAAEPQTDASRQIQSELSSTTTGGPEKRPSSTDEVQAQAEHHRSPKRPRVASPPRDVPRPGQQEPPASTLPVAVPTNANYAGDEDEDDEDVEIPSLVMGDDEDDDEESGEE